MRKKIDEEISVLSEQLKEVKDLEELKQTRSKFVTKSKLLNDLKANIKNAANKSEIGQNIKHYTSNVLSLINAKKNELENSFLIKKRENALLTNKNIELSNKKGVIHPLTELNFLIGDFFEQMNYQYTHGLEVDTEKFNFDLLNIPPNHSAREMHDTFFLKNNKLLRTHSTNNTARSLYENSNLKDFRSYSIGTVFRNDENDATHSFQFNQVDFFTIGNYNIGNLKYTINKLVSQLFSKETKTKFRPSYFPFTEPSFEVDIKCPHCDGNGCNICSQSGYIEILGSGMFCENVLKNVKRDPAKVQGIAAGIGLERVAMIKWNIKDIRKFYLNELDFLNNFKEKR